MEFKNGGWSLEGTLNESNPNYMFTPTGYGVRKFRIKSVTFDPVYGSLNWSYSNVIQLDMGFDSSQVDTFLIPNAFTPGGVNPVFKVSNPAVLPGEAQMYIYNRWGEIFYRCDALEGWDGTDGKGELVPDGIYVYVIEARYRRQLKHIPGTIMVLK
jgi:gliding motility-associated-like protein